MKPNCINALPCPQESTHSSCSLREPGVAWLLPISSELPPIMLPFLTFGNQPCSRSSLPTTGPLKPPLPTVAHFLYIGVSTWTVISFCFACLLLPLLILHTLAWSLLPPGCFFCWPVGSIPLVAELRVQYLSCEAVFAIVFQHVFTLSLPSTQARTILGLLSIFLNWENKWLVKSYLRSNLLMVFLWLPYLWETA